MARPSGKKAFLARLRNSQPEVSAPKKTVNRALEDMLDRMMEAAIKEDSELTFEQKMALGSLVLKVEAVRNRMQDEDFGIGFLDEPSTSEQSTVPDMEDGIIGEQLEQ